MSTIVNLYSDKAGEIKRFLDIFYNNENLNNGNNVINNNTTNNSEKENLAQKVLPKAGIGKTIITIITIGIICFMLANLALWYKTKKK